MRVELIYLPTRVSVLPLNYPDFISISMSKNVHNPPDYFHGAKIKQACAELRHNIKNKHIFFISLSLLSKLANFDIFNKIKYIYITVTNKIFYLSYISFIDIDAYYDVFFLAISCTIDKLFLTLSRLNGQYFFVTDRGEAVIKQSIQYIPQLYATRETLSCNLTDWEFFLTCL